MVIGPTPPGTGVIALTLFFTWSKQTSPTILSSTRVVPTSMITAPSLTISAVTKSGFPIAATKISAF